MKATRCLTAMISPFSHHFDDPNVTEVVVNHPGHYGVERAGQWEWHDAPELTFHRLDAVGIAAAAETSQDFSRANPVCGTRLPGGQRFQINRPPATHDGIITVCIRRPMSRPMYMDDDDFDNMTEEVNSGFSHKEKASDELIRLFDTKDWRAFCKLGIEEGMNIGVCGYQGSGKTELIKRFMNHKPAYRRVVTIEDDSPEFGDAGPPNKVAFFYGRQGLTAPRITAAALRMRADDVIFQEIRGPEAYFLVQGGIRGTGIMTTWHSEINREFDALATMYQQSEFSRNLTHDQIVERIRSVFDIIIWQYRDARAQKFRIARIWFRGMEETPNA
jgi:type IV secretion system protein VirB11